MSAIGTKQTWVHCKCPLLGVKRTSRQHLSQCPLMTQSGHLAQSASNAGCLPFSHSPGVTVMATLLPHAAPPVVIVSAVPEFV